MSYSGVLGSNFEKPFSYFESAPSNFGASLNLGPKMP